MDEAELRERLEAEAVRLPVGDPPIDRFVEVGRHRRWRSRLRLSAAGVVVVLAASGLIWSISSLTGMGRGRVASSHEGQVTRFDVPGRPIRRVAVGGGAAWFIVQEDGGGRLILVRIDAQTGEIRTVKNVGIPQYVAAGFGSVWVSSATACVPKPPPEAPDTPCSNTVLFELDPSTGETLARVPTGGEQIVSMAAGEGAVWIMLQPGGRDNLVRVDPRALRVVARIPLSGCCGTDIAAGEGAVWVLNDRGVTRVDPDTNRVVGFVRIKNADSLAAGAGFMWVNTGHVYRPADVVLVDPKTNTTVRSIVGPGFGYPMVFDGKVWIATLRKDRTIALEYAAPSASAFSRFPVALREGSTKSVLIGSFGNTAILGIGEGAIWTGTDNSWQIIRIDLEASPR
jgi:hypothetical protein